jgi:hypothetical protein
MDHSFTYQVGEWVIGFVMLSAIILLGAGILKVLKGIHDKFYK